MFEHDMLVQEHRQAEAAHFSNPGMCTGVVLMIPGDKESAVARGQPSERLRVRGQPPDTSVNHVARHRDHVRFQFVDRIHDSADVAVLDRGADMDIGDLHNTETMQRSRQACDWNLYVPNLRPAARVEESYERNQHREYRNRSRTPDAQLLEGGRLN